MSVFLVRTLKGTSRDGHSNRNKSVHGQMMNCLVVFFSNRTFAIQVHSQTQGDRHYLVYSQIYIYQVIIMIYLTNKLINVFVYLYSQLTSYTSPSSNYVEEL